MRQAGVSLEHDDRPRPVTGVPQPASNPIAVEVAERYAKALTLSATVPAPAERRTPRRSRAAMRDRALGPGGRTAISPGAGPTRAAPATVAPARPAVAGPGSAVAPRPRTRGAAAGAEAAVAPRPRTRAAAPDAGSPVARMAWSDEAPVASQAPAADTAGGVSERRTVTIRGRGAERDLSWSEYHSRRRPAVPAHERPGFQPDRAALWAFFLGLLLVLVAATSAHGAVLMHAVH